MVTGMTQLDRIEASERLNRSLLTGLVGLFTALLQGQNAMALTVIEFAAQLDAATTAEAVALDAQNTKIDAVATELQSLFDRLQAAGTPQATLDLLAASVAKLGATGTALTAQGARLTAMAVDPTNPVPIVTPPPVAGPAVP